MRRTPAGWKPLILLVTSAAACSLEPRGAGDVATPPPTETVEPTAPSETPAEFPAPAPDPAPSPSSAPAPAVRVSDVAPPAGPPKSEVPFSPVPLEKLLQVPTDTVGRPPELDMDEVLRREITADVAAEEASAEEAESLANKLRLDVGVRTDEPIERRGLKREQVDAAAAVDVSTDTRIKGGVRIERDSNAGVESNRNTTPTIGIEKRF